MAMKRQRLWTVWGQDPLRPGNRMFKTEAEALAYAAVLAPISSGWAMVQDHWTREIRTVRAIYPTPIEGERKYPVQSKNTD